MNIILTYFMMVIAVFQGPYPSSLHAHAACVDWRNTLENRICFHDKRAGAWVGYGNGKNP